MSHSFPKKEAPIIKELVIWLLIATGLVFAFTGSEPQHDDLTMVYIKIEHSNRG